MSNSTWTTRPNTASAFKARPNDPPEFSGEADIDEEKYRVVIEPEVVGAKFTTRDITFTGESNGMVFTGRVFDGKRDNATGQEKALKDKAPRYTGTVKATVNEEFTVEKRVAIWEKGPTKKGEPWLSINIQDNTPYKKDDEGGPEDSPF